MIFLNDIKNNYWISKFLIFSFHFGERFSLDSYRLHNLRTSLWLRKSRMNNPIFSTRLCHRAVTKSSFCLKNSKFKNNEVKRFFKLVLLTVSGKMIFYRHLYREKTMHFAGEGLPEGLNLPGRGILINLSGFSFSSTLHLSWRRCNGSRHACGV